MKRFMLLLLLLVPAWAFAQEFTLAPQSMVKSCSSDNATTEVQFIIGHLTHSAPGIFEVATTRSRPMDKVTLVCNYNITRDASPFGPAIKTPIPARIIFMGERHNKLLAVALVMNGLPNGATSMIFKTEGQ